MGSENLSLHNCAWGRCTAVGLTDYCPVHDPNALLIRAKSIVHSHLANARVVEPSRRVVLLLERLEASIMLDLDSTV